MQRLDAGLRARAWVQEALSAGATLSRLLLEQTAPAVGEVWAFMPDGFLISSLKRFTHSIDWGGEQGAIGDQQIAWLHQQLREPGAWLVMEDRFMRAPEHDPAPRYFFSGAEVYYAVLPDQPVKAVDMCLRCASRWPSLGFRGQGGQLNGDVRGLQLTLEDLRVLAEHTTHVIVGAFDEEGYLVWDLGAGAR